MTKQTGIISFERYNIQKDVEYHLILESIHNVFRPFITYSCEVELFLNSGGDSELIYLLLDMHQNMKKETIYLDSTEYLHLGHSVLYGCYIKEIIETCGRFNFRLGTDYYKQTDVSLLFMRKIKLDKLRKKIKTLKSA